MSDTATKTCFLICPIGPEGSDIRKRADDLLELAITPALEVFGFSVVRADKISRPSLITNDIIALVQESDICIADLTDRNPNVFYEVGRRHETGKPIIQVIQKDQDIPFDLAGIRTIQYDLSNPRSVHEFVQDVRSFVAAFEKSNYAIPGGGVSLASIAQSIERLERSVAKITTASKASPLPSAVMPDADDDPGPQAEIIRAMMTDPIIAAVAGARMQIEAFISSGQIDEAAALLKQSRSRLTDDLYHRYAFMIAMAGHATGMAITLEALEAALDGGNLDEENMHFWLGSLVHYFTSRDEESEGIQKLARIFEGLLKYCDGNPRANAFVLNQMAKIYSGAEQSETALSYATRAVELQPDEEAYQRNLRALQKKVRGTKTSNER